ncbi:MAG: phage holin, LLH family [Bacteroidota bacterium]
MNETLWRILEAFGMALMPIFVAFVAILVQRINLQNREIIEGKQKMKDMIIQRAIFAAEQKYADGQNEEKLSFALSFAISLFQEHKIKYKTATLLNLIEAEIWNSLNSPTAKGIANLLPIPIIKTETNILESQEEATNHV